jgi:nucleoside-diphosphate-sugar epimerase
VSPDPKTGAARRRTILVTGGAGYVGAVLVPRLLAHGHRVRVLDLYLYEPDPLRAVRGHPAIEEVRGDIRDQARLRQALAGCDTVIHLACISNDPSFDLDPALGRSINFDAFEPLVRLARDAGVDRFLYASSSSVYGVKSEPDVHEDARLEPLTDYSRYKALCEEVLARYQAPGFSTCTLRPATVCGYSPRQRLDVIVNILTNHAVNTGTIKVLGGAQKRPNIHIDDMVEAYVALLDAPDEQIAGRVYNVGGENVTVRELADRIRSVVGPDRVTTVVQETNDPRSYHISSDRVAREVGFRPKHTVEDAARDLVSAFARGDLPDPLTDVRYFNVAALKARNLR